MKQQWDHIQRLRRIKKEYEQLTAKNSKRTAYKTKQRIREIEQVFKDNKITLLTKTEQS